MSDPAVLLDADLNFVTYSPSYPALTGLRRRQLASLLESRVSTFELIGSDSANAMNTARICMATKRPMHLAEQIVSNREGIEFTVHLTYLPVLNQEQESEGVIQVFRDVSAEARLQGRYKALLAQERLRAENLESEVQNFKLVVEANEIISGIVQPEQLSLILEALFRVLPVDRGCVLVGSAPDALEVVATRGEADNGWTSQTVLRQVFEGRKAVRIENSEDEDLDQPLLSTSVRGSGARSLICAPMMHGDQVLGAIQIDSRVQTTAFNDDALQLVAAIARQAAIALKNIHLVKEMQTNAEVRYARTSGIVSGVAHEMGTPIGIINMASSTISKLSSRLTTGSGDAEALSEDIQESCMLLEKNIEKVSTLLSSFKQLTASGESEMTVEVDLKSLLEDGLQTCATELAERSIAVEMHCLAEERFPWTGYPRQILQVLVHVIRNVVRHAYPNTTGGSIRIGLVKREKSYQITFTDQGVGIPANMLPHIFEPFAASRQTGRSPGLSLAISHNIVTNLLQGTIDCASVPGEGTSISIELPFSAR